MNIKSLMKYIAYHLHTIVKYYPSNSSLDTFSFFLQDNYEIYCARSDFEDEVLTPDIMDSLYTNLIRSDTFNAYMPLLFTVNSQITYSLIPTPEGIFVIGPVQFHGVVNLKNQVITEKHIPSAYLNSVSICFLLDLINDTLLVYNLFQTDALDYNILLSYNYFEPQMVQELYHNLSKEFFSNLEYNHTHNFYELECRELYSIQNGDSELLDKILSEDRIGKITTLAKDELRNAKNHAIIVDALACRAAIKGGLHPEIAFSMCDVHIQKLEDLIDPHMVYTLIYQYEFEYVRAVNEANLEKKESEKNYENHHVNQCKDYIFKHLHDKLLTRDIAAELGLSPNYLCRIFHQHQGTTITDYIYQEKIKLTKNLLIYSPYTYSEIASYLSFSSQSHLGKVFKRYTALTLNQFRKKYGVKEFISP